MFDRQFDRLPQSADYTRRNYRVMVKRANGQIFLARLCRSRAEAFRLAKKACEEHVDRLKADGGRNRLSRSRPKEVFIEAWRGGLTSGSWVLLRCNEPPFRLPFKFHDYPSTGSHKIKANAIVACVLLPEKTRKGGWRAKVPGTIHQGPITDWQSVPETKAAGESIMLRICSVSTQTGRAQFAVAKSTELN
ncbi:hypothetical protein N9Y42_02915 [Mariniblastus sp.]|nr:hypothetical protein [Mariniblastus sp.]